MTRRHRRPWRHRWRHSLRARLITVFVLLAIAMAAVFIGGVQRALSTGWRDAARPIVSDYMDRLVAEIGSPPDVAKAEALVARLPLSVRISGPSVNWESEPARARRGWLDDRPDKQGLRGPERDWLTRTTVDGHRITFGLGTLPWQHEPGGIGWLTLGLLLALTVAAYAYVRRLLRPLDDIRAGAERFGAGTFNEPIPLRRRDELGDLAQRINTMAHDIEGMLDAKRGLLLALSHELRSPLTRARLNAELLPATAESQTERDALLRDLNEMRDLISDLLESERLASPHAALQREPVDLAALVREVVAELPGGETVTLDLAPDLPSRHLDRARARLLVRNLLDNALRYSVGAAQPPQLTLRAEAGGRRGEDPGGRQDGKQDGRQGVRIDVRDFGPGVDAAQLDHLTEPFYRTDSARQRATGGVGLGLHLCRLVAEAHGGVLTLRNAAPGLVISVLLR